ncbi:MAG: NAD-dependent epimerase/dehydratase family protein [Halofilum sp. (in: g-proteobacteria)]|nr:NAD-dependent epimerase/dehydratase family protein [Halofilum sp. (in: g-proteobacteria)]
MHDSPVTVFGGTGFLGAAIARHLDGQGLAVRVAARHPGARLPGAASACEADLADPAAVARAIAGARMVVNAVGLYRESAAASFETVHVDGAARLARAAREAGVARLVHVSGIGADPGSPSRYVAARGRGEAAVRAAFPDAVILRPSVLFGEQDAFLATLARLVRLPVVPLFGTGRTRLQPVHVDDVAAAVAALAGDAGGRVRLLELGGADVLAWREIVTRVARHRGRRPLLLPVPFAAWRALAACAAVLPAPPITRDQLALMAADNVATGPGFDALGLQPRGLLAALPDCLPPGR